MENKKITKSSLQCEYCGMRHENIDDLKKHLLTHRQSGFKVEAKNETMKNDIVASIEKSKTKKGSLQFGSMTVTFILIVLTAVSILQTIESYNVMKKIEGGNFGAGAAASGVPSSIDSLPNMVGGC